ncbi:MAG: adenylate/guanylate cyclase domain-containing protein [Solirubrobacterales bacterium]|nr:adenylate/guanylate cyclase domain-containing protein [Solirubrobacterales bacterium]
MLRGLDALYRRLGSRYPLLAIAALFPLTALVTLGGLWLLTLYERQAATEIWRLVLVAELLVVLENVLSLLLTRRLLRPAQAWLSGDRSPEAVRSAWKAVARLPLDFVTYRTALPVLVNIVPFAVYIILELELPWSSAPFLVAGSAVVLLYGVFLRFFAMEIVLRPVLEDVAGDLREEPDIGRPTLPLRWRLLLALPAINVITGVVVSGLTADGPRTLADLGWSVLFAVLVAFTLSLGLSVLLSRTIAGPIANLRRATARVAAGDLAVRVPVVALDETGRLASSFNQMVAGLQEREALRAAFGTYVDPDLADRVLAEGAVLEGEEVDVSVLFLDIREFTAFTERASAREVVGTLNAFFDLVVPVLVRHGGHTNKFVGDGLLGVFGAPEPMPDHADSAVAASLEVVETVRERFGDTLRIGIGVNSGRVIAGTIGGGGRLEFTVIGDPVNTAARVERVTRQTGDNVLVTEATRRSLTRPGWRFEPRGTVPLEGKTEQVQLHVPVPVLPRRTPRQLRTVGEGPG